MNQFSAWAMARLSEPSTWAGIAGVISGMTFLPNASGIAGMIPAIGAVVAGLIAMAKKG